MTNLAQATELFARGDRKGAFRELARLLGSDYKNIPAWRMLALLVDEPQKKADCYRQILRLDPNDTDAQVQLRLLLGGFPKTPVSEGATAVAAAARTAPPIAKPTPQFARTQHVRLRRDPNQRGVIVNPPIESPSGWQYEVFFGADRRFVAESDLEPVSELDVDSFGHVRMGTLDDLLRQLVLVKQKKGLTDSLYAYRASRTKFEVYQFKPALKFLNNPEQRLLIADEVGLGKTIEAGIILLEMQARLESMSRVLVVCPSNLRQKWYDELRSRFDETFTIFESTTQVRKFVDDYQRMGIHTRLKGIVSLELIRREEFAEALAQHNILFDLVIIDEAHHCRNPETLSNNVASVLSENADAMLLLTATPLQLGDQDLFALLQVLSPGEFDNLAAFRKRLEPNRHINAASQLLAAQKMAEALRELRKVELTDERQRFLQNPYYRELLADLQKSTLAHDQLVNAQRNLFNLNTLAPIFTRTRKREVQEQAPIRSPYTLSVAFTQQERDFYDRMIAFVREQFLWNTGRNWAPAWAVMMRERQAASCISAIREQFALTLQGKYAKSVEDETALQGILEEEVDIELEHSLFHSLRALLHTAEAIGEVDTKFDVFLKALQEILSENPSTKILLFSFFRGTLEYLNRRLSHLGFGVLMMHGGHKVTERQATVEEFRNNARINILLSSEVGSEGLDFQFCDTLFNYDLPWNPMKVEQRIGRIDRFGQQASRIRIYNLVIADTIEERIFLRLYDRIDIFKSAIGDLEAILGEEIRELSKKIFTSSLTPAEEAALADQAARNIVNRKQEMERFESERLRFMGQDAIFAGEVEQTIDSGRFVSESEVKALVESFLREKFRGNRIQANGDGTYYLDLDHDFVDHIRAFLYAKGRSNDPTVDEFFRRLASNERRGIPVTFSANLAYDRKLVEFITLRHPFAQAAVEFWKDEPLPQLPVARIAVQGPPSLCGDYYFFVYAFALHGLDRQSTLLAVTVSMRTLEVVAELNAEFLRLIQEATQPAHDPPLIFDNMQFYKARAIALAYAASERDRREAELRRSNEAIVSARLAARTQTYQIKRRMVEEYLHRAKEPRIQRMREAQLRNMDAKHTAAVQALSAQRQVVAEYSLELAGLARVLTH